MEILQPHERGGDNTGGDAWSCGEKGDTDRSVKVVGFKTGYTPEAGLTLITLARINGYEIIGVLLGSGDRRDEARELLDYSFKKLGVQ